MGNFKVAKLCSLLQIEIVPDCQVIFNKLWNHNWTLVLYWMSQEKCEYNDDKLKKKDIKSNICFLKIFNIKFLVKIMVYQFWLKRNSQNCSQKSVTKSKIC